MNAAAYTNEYTALPKDSQLSQVFRARYAGNYEGDDDGGMFPTSEYLCWAREPTDRLAFEELLLRADLEKWLYGLFLKLEIPMTRGFGMFWSIIYAPMNLAVFFRLLIRLYEIGYPAHWLSGVLTRILTNKVTTSARAPKNSPLTFEESGYNAAIRPIDTSPYIPEMSTLASLFRPILPFGIMTDLLTIPTIDTIRHYTLHLKTTAWFQDLDDGKRPDFIILLMSDGMYRFGKREFECDHIHNKVKTGVAMDLRAMLIDNKVMKQYTNKCALVTTWEWDREKTQGAFWMSRDVVERLGRSGDKWNGSIWRTDSWTPVCAPVVLTPKTLVPGDYWNDRKL